ncbi:MAG: hypothetical protein Q9165_004142 [Trypethelium subeluteriae]
MTAAEYGFPDPPSPLPTWAQVASNVFNDMASRWNSTYCDGGLLWQIYASNVNGQNYKNSISNGGLFQLGARLARYTGNTTYSEWAEKAWDWTAAVGLIDPASYAVYDGTDSSENCTSVDHDQWSYNVGMFIYGAAHMYNISGTAAAPSASAATWQTRLEGLVNGTSVFVSPFSNATNVMFEVACEKEGTCDTDQFSFKGFLARWLSQSSVLAPQISDTIAPWLQTSAQAAAQSCTGLGNSSCGTKWWVEGFDGVTGAGQQMSALEVIDSLLVGNGDAPLKGAAASSSSQPSSSSSSVDTSTLVTWTTVVPTSSASAGASTTALTSGTTSATTTADASVMGGLASAIASMANQGKS